MCKGERMKRHIGIDIGAESGRAVVGWLEGGKLVTEEIHRFSTKDVFLIDKRVRNIYRYYEEIISALRIYREVYGDELESIGVDAWGSDFVLLDTYGNILGIPVSYRECRKGNIDQLIEKKIGAAVLYEKTGNQAMQRDTLHQLLGLYKNEPETLLRARAILFLGDVFHYFLSGEICCEHSLASFSHMFNRHADSWDKEIFDAFDIPHEICSRVVTSGTVLGNIPQRLCSELKLRSGIKVVSPCTHDTANAAFTVPDLSDDWVFISSGTWALLGIETDSPFIGREAYEFNLSNSSMGTGQNMLQKIMAGMWIIQECFSTWKKYTYNDIVREARQQQDCDLFLDPDADVYFSSGNMPYTVTNELKRYYGEEIEESNVGKISYIFFQSIALKYCYVLRRIAEITGRNITKIYMLGGGSRNELINQFTANVTGISVYTGIYEATADGNLLLQMYGCGEVESRSRIKKITYDTYSLKEYIPENKEKWKEKYSQFIRAPFFVNNW